MVGRARLTMTVTNVLVVTIVVVALLLVSFFVARRVINQNADNDLIAIAESVQRATGNTGFGAIGRRPSPFSPFRPDGTTRIDLREFARRDPPLEFAIYDTSGAVAVPFEQVTDPFSLEDDVQLALLGNQQISTVKRDGVVLRVVTQPVTDTGGNVVAAVQVAESRQAQEQIVNTLRNVLIAVGGVGLLFAAGAGYLLTGRAMRPVNVAFERQKSFVADAAHELRTPLAIISANAEALDMQETVLPDEDRELLTGIRTESSYLAALVSKLLEMAKLDFEDGELRVDSVDLVASVKEACDAVSVLADAKQITLKSPSPGESAIVRGDEVLVRLIVLSLLDNAIKYSFEGGTVSVEVVSNNSTVSVRIEDTGPGIPPEHRERIFDRFYRVDRARSRQTGGAGLGLAIAKRAAEVIHGHLQLASGNGSDSNPGTIATVSFEKA